MKTFFGKLIGVQDGEWKRSLLMFLYALFLLSAYLILKPVRNSLFLEKFDAKDLVFMYMIIAVFAALIISGYTKIGSRLTLNRFISGTTIFIILNLVGFWWLITQQYDWLVYVFYVWVSLFGAITTSQFWLLANHVFDAREAKRLFPFIGAGAITGGLVGSKLTNLLAGLVGTEGLLWVCVVLMICTLGLLAAIWPTRSGVNDTASKRRRKLQVGGTWPLIFRSRYLKLLTTAIALTVMVSTFIDFQFNWVVQENFPDKDSRTAFFGDFFFWLSLISLVLQLAFTSRFLRKFGVGAAIMILPVGLLLGSTVIFLWPTLIWSAISVKLSDGAFRYSINKSGMELLYLPISSTIKDRIKGLMDVVGDRFARGIGGAMLFVVTGTLTWSIGEVSILSGVLIAAWIVLAVLLRKEYSIAFRDALQRRTIDLDQIRVDMRDAGGIEALSQAINNTNASQAIFALGMTADIIDERLKEPLLELQLHTDARVRAEAMRQLRQFSEPEMAIRIYPFIIDDDPSVRVEAVRYICEHVPPDDERGIHALLSTEDLPLKATIFRCALEQMEKSNKLIEIEITSDSINNLLADTSKDNVISRRELAHAIGYVTAEHPLAEKFPQFLSDEDVEVQRNAIGSAGRRKRRDLVPKLLELLSKPKLRSEVIAALISYGPSILGALRDALFDDQTNWRIRVRIPKVIALIGGDDAAHILLSRIDTTDVALRFTSIKALGTLRRREPELIFDKVQIQKALENEARCYYTRCLQLSVFTESAEINKSEQFFIQSLKDRRSLGFEQFFRLSGLIYNQLDIIHAYESIRSGASARRARAIEFLDTVWTRRDKELMFPALEGRKDELIAARKLFNLSKTHQDSALNEILTGEDSWLAATAVQMIKDNNLTKYRDSLTELSQSRYRPLAETASSALQEFASA